MAPFESVGAVLRFPIRLPWQLWRCLVPFARCRDLLVENREIFYTTPVFFSLFCTTRLVNKVVCVCVCVFSATAWRGIPSEFREDV